MKKNNVLIVEDDALLRETWIMFFETYGVSIHTATNGLEAVEIIDQHPIELIVTDLTMPVKDGYFVLEHIKSKKINVKTWVYSGHLLSNEKMLENYNVDKILTKPFDMKDSVNEIMSLVSEK